MAIEIVFHDSGFFALVASMQWSGIARDGVEVTAMADDSRAWIPPDMFDPGAVAMEILFFPGQRPPIAGDAERVTIRHGDSGASYSVILLVQTWEFEASTETRMAARVECKASGEIEWSAALPIRNDDGTIVHTDTGEVAYVETAA